MDNSKENFDRVDLSDEELNNVAGRKMLSDEALSNVAGGTGNDICTNMVCTNCGNTAFWAGNFLGKYFDCNCCYQHTLYGQSTVERDN